MNLSVLGFCFVLVCSWAPVVYAQSKIIPEATFAAQSKNPAGDTTLLHPQLVRVTIPKDKTANVTFGWGARGKPYFEQAMLVYIASSDTNLAEYMRWGTERHNQRGTDLKLEGGKTYVFAAWHIQGAANSFTNGVRNPWVPSRCRLVADPNGFTLQVNDGDARVNGSGDGNYDDTIVTIRW